MPNMNQLMNLPLKSFVDGDIERCGTCKLPLTAQTSSPSNLYRYAVGTQNPDDPCEVIETPISKAKQYLSGERRMTYCNSTTCDKGAERAEHEQMKRDMNEMRKSIEPYKQVIKIKRKRDGNVRTV